jgi:uncharacterized membrane protein
VRLHYTCTGAVSSMTIQLALAIALHQLATVVWVGGMFFAHFALRQSVQRTLEPPQRMALLLAVFGRFFGWVWIAVVALWASGFWIFSGIYGGSMGWHVHAMMLVAVIMSVLFFYIYFVPYRAMGKLAAAGDWAGAAARLAVIRRVILANLLLGLLTAALGSAGRYLQ